MPKRYRPIVRFVEQMVILRGIGSNHLFRDNREEVFSNLSH